MLGRAAARAEAAAAAAAAADRSLSDLGRFLVWDGEAAAGGLAAAWTAGASVETLMGKRRVDDRRRWRGENALEAGDVLAASGEAGMAVSLRS